MTAPPNAPEVDVKLPKWHEELVGMMPGAGLYEHQQEWVKYEDAFAAVAALLTREAALVAEVDRLRRLLAADLEYDAASLLYSEECLEWLKEGRSPPDDTPCAIRYEAAKEARSAELAALTGGAK